MSGSAMFEFVDVERLSVPGGFDDSDDAFGICLRIVSEEARERSRELVRTRLRPTHIKSFPSFTFGKAEIMLPRQVPLPKYVACTLVSRNFLVDDDPVLRYVPYFGEDDLTGIDLSVYKTPGEEMRALTEQEKIAAFACGGTARALSRLAPERRRLVAEFLAPSSSGARIEEDEDGLRKNASNFEDLSDSYRDLFCRRCYTYDCADHGARQPLPRERRDPPLQSRHREVPSSENERNPIVKRKIDAVLSSKCVAKAGKVVERVAQSNARRRRRSWKHGHSHQLTRSYVPCDHDGECGMDCCPCVKERPGGFCEKYCACPPWCSARFRGCDCSATDRVCRGPACECFAQGRECDPDICKKCVDCPNQSLARNRHKRIAVGRSSTHGWGSFCLEQAKAGDLVGEYRGQLVSHDEADRRGKVYDKVNSSFLFNLDDNFVVDATRHGAKIKFANHNDKDPNLAPRVVFVRGDYRIGLYAKRDIQPGDELSFDYSNAFWEATKRQSNTGPLKRLIPT